MECPLGDIFDGGGWERRVPAFLHSGAWVRQERQRRCEPDFRHWKIRL